MIHRTFLNFSDQHQKSIDLLSDIFLERQIKLILTTATDRKRPICNFLHSSFTKSSFFSLKRYYNKKVRGTPFRVGTFPSPNLPLRKIRQIVVSGTLLPVTTRTRHFTNANETRLFDTLI